MITYMVENECNEIIGYSTQLCEAKRIGEKSYASNRFLITKLVGPYKYEGYHDYYLVYDGKKYKKTKDRRQF